MEYEQSILHKQSARARDTVTVVKLTEESFLKALMQQYAEQQQGVNDDIELYSTKVRACAWPPLCSRLWQQDEGLAFLARAAQLCSVVGIDAILVPHMRAGALTCPC